MKKVLFYNRIPPYGPVAQLVEQQPFKLMVMGSIPIRPTKKAWRQNLAVFSPWTSFSL